MDEKTFNAQDAEVIGMVNQKRGPGGQLPGRVVAVLPAARAEQALALDERIQKLKNVMPLIAAGCAAVFALCLSALGWMHPSLAIVFGIALMANAVAARREAADGD